MYNLNIWDLSGHEKYYFVTKIFIQGSYIVILVYQPDKLNILDY